MPIHRGTDKHGNYWRWGNQKKYYYRSKKFPHHADDGRQAKQKAINQALAVYYMMKHPRSHRTY